MALKHGQTVMNILERSKTTYGLVKALILLPMGTAMWVSLKPIVSAVRAPIHMVMAVLTSGIGLITNKMGKVSTPRKMAINTSVRLWIINQTAKAAIPMPTVMCTWVSTRTVKNMVKARLLLRKATPTSDRSITGCSVVRALTPMPMGTNMWVRFYEAKRAEKGF